MKSGIYVYRSWYKRAEVKITPLLGRKSLKIRFFFYFTILPTSFMYRDIFLASSVQYTKLIPFLQVFRTSEKSRITHEFVNVLSFFYRFVQ